MVVQDERYGLAYDAEGNPEDKVPHLIALETLLQILGQIHHGYLHSPHKQAPLHTTTMSLPRPLVRPLGALLSFNNPFLRLVLQLLPLVLLLLQPVLLSCFCYSNRLPLDGTPRTSSEDALQAGMTCALPGLTDRTIRG